MRRILVCILSGKINTLLFISVPLFTHRRSHPLPGQHPL
jgi:uncharacterized protein YifN (PemK superfamily)